jgi:hypothetical protein
MAKHIADQVLVPAGLLVRIDADLHLLFGMTERLCREAHLDDEDISRVLSTSDNEVLEIISDTADEVLVKATAIITEARLAMRLAAGGVE